MDWRTQVKTRPEPCSALEFRCPYEYSACSKQRNMAATFCSAAAGRCFSRTHDWNAGNLTPPSPRLAHRASQKSAMCRGRRALHTDCPHFSRGMARNKVNRVDDVLEPTVDFLSGGTAEQPRQLPKTTNKRLGGGHGICHGRFAGLPRTASTSSNIVLRSAARPFTPFQRRTRLVITTPTRGRRQGQAT